MSWIARLLALGALVGTGTAAGATPEIPDDWYDVEVLIFLRTDGSQSDEQLLTDATRRYPANLLAPAFTDDANPGGGYAPVSGVAEPYPEADPNANALGGIAPASTADEAPAPKPAAAPVEPGALPADAAEASTERAVPTPPATARERLEQALADYQGALEADAYRWRDASNALSLSASASALARRGIGQVLLHGAWRQPVPDREQPQPVLIQSNVPVEDRWQVEGTVAVTRGRFLHVDAELWFQPFLPDARGESSDDARASYGSPAVDPDLPYELLSEHRRMRSGELHYLDHPTFGMLLRVTPVEPPAALTELVEQLEKGVE